MSIQVEHYGTSGATAREQVQRQLESVMILDKRIGSRTAEIARLRDKLNALSRALNGDSAGGPRRDWTNVSDQLLDAVDVIEREIRALKEQRSGVVALIAVLPQRLQLLIELRYLRGMAWWQVANEMNCGRTTVWEMHGEALNFLAGRQKSEHH